MILQIKTFSAADWATRNSVLLNGEPGFESDSRKIKVGDGVTRWNDLPYSWLFGGSSGSSPGPSSEPTLVGALSVPVSNYHQAQQVLDSHTFHSPPAGVTQFALVYQFSASISGAAYSGADIYAAVGIPAAGTHNCGGIIGDEVSQVGLGGSSPGSHDVIGQAVYPEDDTHGVYGCLVSLGLQQVELGQSNGYRVVVYDNTIPNTDLTVQFITGEDSGADFDFMPQGSENHILGPIVVGPAYDTNSKNISTLQAMCRDLYVLDYTTAIIHRYSVGRRPLAAYLGIQERLLYRSSIALSGQTVTFGGMVIDKNGIIAVYSPTANTVTLVDVLGNGRRMAQLVTTASLGAAIDYVQPAPDGSGFWVAVHNTSLVKINPTTGAVITTIALTTPGTLYLAISPDGSKAYLWNSTYGGIQTINLGTSAITNGPVIAGVSKMALSPDGLNLIVAAGNHTTWAVAKVPVPAINGTPVVGATIKYAARIGAQLTNLQIYAIAISADSKMWFVSGGAGVWAYGWTSDCSVFDGQSAEVSGAAQGFIAVTDNDGIYIAWSNGTSPGGPGTTARIFGYPGSTFTCDPSSIHDYMEVFSV